MGLCVKTSRLFTIAVTLVVILYSCITHLTALCCTNSILLIRYCWYRSHVTVVYSSVGHTSVEYAVAFTLASHWYKVLLLSVAISCVNFNYLQTWLVFCWAGHIYFVIILSQCNHFKHSVVRLQWIFDFLRYSMEFWYSDSILIFGIHLLLSYIVHSYRL